MLCEIISETKGTIINLPIQGDINVSRDDYIEINNVRYVVVEKNIFLKLKLNLLKDKFILLELLFMSCKLCQI